MPAYPLFLSGLTVAAMVLVAPICGGAPANPSIDHVFAGRDKPDAPGCAVAVTRANSIVYSSGYGSANLELGRPITVHSVFDIGSVSKQFTAMSVLLLAQDGRLSLDDDIHKFIPELPDYGAALTLRTLLHHLSGLRSYTDLFDLAGVPEVDLSTDDDALALIARQKTLNFAPGHEYLYSDTNYFLLALVVRRVSGETLREFAQRRIFRPLGMNQTHFHNDHRMLVPQRATGYSPRAGGGFEIDMSNFEELGDGSVMTTVLDLARWDRNFDVPRVGGKEAVALLQDLGIRSDGSRSPYAMGLILDEYRGIPRVQHTGEWVGYRSSYLRFPTQHLSVILLCNVVGDLDALALSERVADVYLRVNGSAVAPDHTMRPANAGTVAEIGAYAGAYWNSERFAYLRFDAAAGVLSLDNDASAQPLIARGKGLFQAANSTTWYAFHAAPDGMFVDAKDDDSDVVRLERLPADRLPIATPAEFAGTYYNDELGVSWTLATEQGHLTRTQWLFPKQDLSPIFADTFIGDLSESTYVLQFSRNSSGVVDGFSVGTSMVRPVRFRRCVPASAYGGGPIALGCKGSVDGSP